MEEVGLQLNQEVRGKEREGNRKAGVGGGIWGCLPPPSVHENLHFNSYYHPRYRGILALKSYNLAFRE